MRKLISFILAAVMVLSAATFMASAATSDGVHGYTPCDVNDDGVVNMKDMLVLKKYFSGQATGRDLDLLAADCNCDGTVDIKDVSYLRSVLASAE